MKEKFNLILAAALDVDISKINENLSADTFPEWDSLKQMNIIVALEEEFDIQFDEDESILLKDYKGLFEATQKKTKGN